ncbi:MAG: sulfur carrier protein ThiS adenylyltransferase ThiF [Bacteroidales bacterium]|jgi:sulfur carrier protein ThiS adenylyltransferase|nr:sulfur carrier protein ThiS adenylyltransferase ThiF [Bacteroidales bacterium]MDD3273036.1 sulfur carrier protein ThiS adenylyltransferase ThiF [Bacteroidales bacterium]MDD4058430.1 sulfur carrier protein ThiS adenylyltransferase ThiF [Bacteroidales bacterium]
MPTYNQIRAFLSQKTIGIAGAGGLGSNCAESLLRCGAGKLIVADYDRVSDSNLNRQFYFHDQIGEKKIEALRDNLLRINPFASLQMHFAKVSPENIALLYSTCDVVVEAFDEASEKLMFIEEMSLQLPLIPVVAASGLAGWGDIEKIRSIKSGNLIICGDGESEVSEDNPTLAPKVRIVSNIQADAVLEILLKELV